jgi:hypothetical protein
MRAEVHGALPVLEQLRISSSIADRGLTLVMPLLEEEKRLKEEADKRRPPRRVSSPPSPRGQDPDGSGLADANPPVRPSHRANRSELHLTRPRRQPPRPPGLVRKSAPTTLPRPPPDLPRSLCRTSVSPLQLSDLPSPPAAAAAAAACLRLRPPTRTLRPACTHRTEEEEEGQGPVWFRARCLPSLPSLATRVGSTRRCQVDR